MDRRKAARRHDLADEETGIRERIAAAVAATRRLRIARSLARYGHARGGLLAGGIAYSALFSIAAALTVAWTVFMTLLGRNADLRDEVLRGIDSALPGIISYGDRSGLLDPDSLVLDSAITPASILATLVLVWTATSVMQALASSVRAMFGITTLKQSFVAVRLRALGGFSVLALGVVASSALTAAVAVADEAIGIHGPIARLVASVCGWGLSLVIDVAVIVFLIRVMSDVRAPRRDLLLGALIVAVGAAALRLAGTSIIGSVSDNPLLASFATVATLLVWLNFGARLFLLGAAFAANPPIPYVPVTAEELHAKDSPNYVTASVPATLDWPHNPISGEITPDLGEGNVARDRLPEDPEPVAQETEPAGGEAAPPVSVPDASSFPDPSGTRLRGPSRWRARRRAERAERKALEAVEKAVRRRDEYEAGLRARD